jgi:hypothetical protein
MLISFLEKQRMPDHHDKKSKRRATPQWWQTSARRPKLTMKVDVTDRRRWTKAPTR